MRDVDRGGSGRLGGGQWGRCNVINGHGGRSLSYRGGECKVPGVGAPAGTDRPRLSGAPWRFVIGTPHG
jgi:hypothetical protein